MSIVDELKTTPQSQGPRRISRMPKWVRALGICVVAIIIGICCVGSLSCTGNTVNADVNTITIGGYVVEIRIQNNDTFDYVDVHLTLNKVYAYEVDTIPAGEVMRVGSSSFVNPNGTSFNYVTTVIKGLSLECQTTKGKGTGTWTWES